MIDPDDPRGRYRPPEDGPPLGLRGTLTVSTGGDRVVLSLAWENDSTFTMTDGARIIRWAEPDVVVADRHRAAGVRRAAVVVAELLRDLLQPDDVLVRRCRAAGTLQADGRITSPGGAPASWIYDPRLGVFVEYHRDDLEIVADLTLDPRPELPLRTRPQASDLADLDLGERTLSCLVITDESVPTWDDVIRLLGQGAVTLAEVELSVHPFPLVELIVDRSDAAAVDALLDGVGPEVTRFEAGIYGSGMASAPYGFAGSIEDGRLCSVVPRTPPGR